MKENMLAIIKEILKKEEVSDNDNFFLLGGDSMKAVQLSQRVRAELGIDIKILSIFQKPKIQDILNAAEVSAKVLDKDEENDQVYHTWKGQLSYEQEGIWIHEAMYPSDYFKLTGYCKLDGTVDTGKLNQAVQETIACHDMLRACIRVNAQSVPELHIEESVQKGLEIQELYQNRESDRNHQQIEETILAISRSLAMDTIENAYHFVYLKTSADTGYFVLAIHHAFSDEMTFGILLKEIITRYQGTFQQSSLPKRQYQDYIDWQRRERKQESLYEYWRARLEGDTRLFIELPYANTVKQGKKYSIVKDLVIDKEQIALLIKQGKKENITTHNIFMAALKVLICQMTGNKTISVGTPVHCKNSADYSNTCGLFVNETISIDTVDETQTFLAFAKGVQETMLEAITHAGLPYEVVIKNLGKSKEMLSLPNRIHYNFIDESGSREWQKELAVGAIHFVETAHLCDFGLIVELFDQEYRVSLVANQSYLSEEALSIIASQFEQFLIRLSASGYGTAIQELLASEEGFHEEEIEETFAF